MDTMLQNGHRDPSGLLTDPLLRIVEQTRADSLRAEMVTYMCLHFEEFHHDTTTANADLSGRLVYNSMQERVEAMAAPTAMVGEIEIIASTKSLRRQIDVVYNNLTLKYGENFQGSPPLVIRFSRIAEDVGHYDCVLTIWFSYTRPHIPSSEDGAESENHAICHFGSDHLQPIQEEIAHGQSKEGEGKGKSNPKSQQACEESSTTHRSEPVLFSLWRGPRRKHGQVLFL